jgi:hypothetical protein
MCACSAAPRHAISFPPATGRADVRIVRGVGVRNNAVIGFTLQLVPEGFAGVLRHTARQGDLESYCANESHSGEVVFNLVVQKTDTVERLANAIRTLEGIMSHWGRKGVPLRINVLMEI